LATCIREIPLAIGMESTGSSRYAFCMRDVSHQSAGAAVLGLAGHTRNMLHRFAASISQSRDWAGFWEINKDSFPAPVDYQDDQHFWYAFRQISMSCRLVIASSCDGRNRREYPEVSYAVIGAIVTGLMGLDLKAAGPEKALADSMYVDGTIQTLPKLTSATQWAELDHVPVRANELQIRHNGTAKTTVANSKGPSLCGAPVFRVPLTGWW
jgi:hypothetical protein